MESFKVRRRVGKDGILHLNIPVKLLDRDVEVMVIYQPIKAENSSEGALDELYGSVLMIPFILMRRVF